MSPVYSFFYPEKFYRVILFVGKNGFRETLIRDFVVALAGLRMVVTFRMNFSIRKVNWRQNLATHQTIVLESFAASLKCL